MTGEREAPRYRTDLTSGVEARLYAKAGNPGALGHMLNVGWRPCAKCDTLASPSDVRANRSCVRCHREGNPTTTAEARGLARAWAASRPERVELLAWVRRETDGYEADAAVGRLLGLLGWEYHAGYGSPSYDDALELLRAARSSR